MKSILKQGKISPLFVEGSTSGMSREVHLVEHDGEKYVLRKCKTKERADLFENISKRFENYGIIPRFVGRHKNNLIFEYLEGRDLKSEDKKYAFKIGELYGKVNSEKSPRGEKYDYRSKFYWGLEFIFDNKIIDGDKYELIKKKFEFLNKRVKLKFGFDIGDLTPDNFRLSKGKIYFIDIEALNPNRTIGYGFAKAFLKWFKTEKSRREFLKGYNTNFSSEYLTKDYLQFIYVFFLITNTVSKMKNNMDYSKNLKNLDLFLEGKLL